MIYLQFDDFIKKWSIPESCSVKKNIYKKYFYEKGDLKYYDKKIFISDIEKITWLYTLKEDTIPIKPYRNNELDYTEIAIIHVKLKKKNRYQRIADLMQRTIPYPLVIIFIQNNQILINVAHKRINKQDNEKSTYEELLFTKWINLSNLKEVDKEFLSSIDINNYSYINFYKFYSDFVNRIIAFNVAVVTGDYKLKNNNELSTSKKVLENIKKLKKEKKQLKSSLNRESQFNKRVDINMQIKKLDRKINHLTKKL